MKDDEAGNRMKQVLVSIGAGALGCALVLLMAGLLPVSDEPGKSDTAVKSVVTGSALDAGDQQGNREPATSAQDDEFAERLKGLRAALDVAAEERAQLASSQLTLNRRTNELEKQLSELNDLTIRPGGSPEIAELAAPPSMPVDEPEAVGSLGRMDRVERQYEDLLAAGLDEQSARDFQSRTDQYQLSRLELFDQAAREGWDASGELGDRLRALDDSQPDLREELGDSAYDRYLYESGSSNRISIDSVITGSAAELAGLQVGDMITGYAGEPIFQVQDLQQATRAGSRGESVQLVFERDGQILSSDILRGPLGVTLRPTREQP